MIPTPGPGSIEISSDSTAINLAAAQHGGRIVWVSDQHEKYPAANLIDGDKRDWGEWWTNEPPRFPQVVVFALAHDQVRTIDHVVLNPWTSEWRYGWIKDFELYVSTTATRLEDMGYVGSFEDVIQRGAEEWGETAGPLGEDRMDSYYWANIATQRKEGVWPIPWR
jgi:hypothetical protein